MNIKKIQDANVSGMRVLMRASFNVPFEGKKIKNDFKARSIKKTLDYLLENGAKVTLVSNLGRPFEYQQEHPGEDEWLTRFSFRNLLPEISKALGVEIAFIPSCDANVIKKEHDSLDDEFDVFLLENIKLYKEEVENDEEFSFELARHFDIFVNESFSDSHRDYVSTTGLAKQLPSFAGFQFQEELKNLERVKKYPEHPAIAIIGGAKIKTKLPLIESFMENYDFILVGGKIANEAIDEGMIFDEKVILPVDFANDDRLDIGEETIEKFKEIIFHAETIVWNGPMGMFEKKPFDKGTMEIMRAVAESDAFSVVGGGESVEAIRAADLMDKFSFVSTGGGAMLRYLSGGEMPGVEILEEK
jgi:3-phosphoglycerate kinase